MPPTSKFALPDIEHEPPRPSRRSTISTNRELARREGIERSKAATAAANARAAKARALAAEQRAAARRDTPPVRTTPEKAGGIKLPGPAADVARTIRRTPQKALVAELVAVVVLTAVREVANGESPGIEPFVGGFVVYLILGFAAELGGEQTARVAAGLGALVLLVVAARTVGPLATAAGVVRSERKGAALAGPGSGVRTMGPHGSGAAGGSHRRPPGGRMRGNNLSNPTGG
jgi:hypothetical protein